MSADLADIIRAYWRQRGCAVDVGVREVTQPGVHGHTYDYRAVRSDMVNGLPRGYRGDEARSYAVPDGPQPQEGRPPKESDDRGQGPDAPVRVWAVSVQPAGVIWADAEVVTMYRRARPHGLAEGLRV